MSSVRITLSQEVVDKDHGAPTSPLLPGGDPKTMFDAVSKAIVAAMQTGSPITSWNLEGSTLLGTLRVQYADGATGTFYGFVMDNPQAASGHARATGFTYSKPGQSDLDVSGALHFDYGINGSVPTLQMSAQGITVNEARLAGKLPGASPNLDPTFGNISLSMKGAFAVAPSGVVSGTLSHIAAVAEKFVRSVDFEGEFEASTMYAGQVRSIVYGPASAYRIVYEDGSLVDVSDTGIEIGTVLQLNTEALQGWRQADDFAVDLPGTLYGDVYVGTGEGDDVVSLEGGGGRLHVATWLGDDVITLLGGSHDVNGSVGLDTVKLAGNRADYTVKYLPPPPPQDPLYTPVGVFEVSDRVGATNSLSGVERLVFADANVALDIDGHGGQVYRLYEAALDRSPDLAGLGFWMHVLDHGLLSLHEIAATFMASTEYQELYGSSQSHLELVTRFYQNIHGRDPEPGGRDFWVGMLDRGVLDEVDVLVAISESAEHQAAMAGVIGTGFAYTPWQG